ncbi:MAG: hypothetical protein ACI83D_000692 [Planctomycetota bacterium]|jgi:hypothetical protein
MLHIKKDILYYLLLGMLLLLGFAAMAVPSSVFAATQPVEGWAWSTQGGWMSSACTNITSACDFEIYGVIVDDVTGLFSGFGLFNPYDDTAIDSNTEELTISPNIGFVDFGPQGGFPVGNQTSTQGAEIDLVTGEISGWIRSCSVFLVGCSGSLLDNTYRGGWDGWISMRGGDDNDNPAIIYGVNVDIETGEFSGYAWGGPTLGWIDFSQMFTEPLVDPILDLTITADPLFVSILDNYETTLLWATTTTPFSLCQEQSTPLGPDWGAGSPNGPPTPPSPQSPQERTNVSVPNSSVLYEIRCQDSLGVWTEWKGVTVQRSDLTIDTVGDGCVDTENSNQVSIVHTNNGPLDMDECFATSSPVISTWYGPYASPHPFVPTANSSVQTDHVVNPSLLPVTFSLTCTDDDGIPHPPAGTVDVEVSEICPIDPPVETPVISLTPSSTCLSENPPPPGEVVDLTIINEGLVVPVTSCVASSSPSVTGWDGPLSLSGGEISVGGFQIFNDIPVESANQRYFVTCTYDGVDSQEESFQFDGSVCALPPPIVDLKAGDPGGPYFDWGPYPGGNGPIYVPLPTPGLPNVELVWENENVTNDIDTSCSIKIRDVNGNAAGGFNINAADNTSGSSIGYLPSQEISEERKYTLFCETPEGQGLDHNLVCIDDTNILCLPDIVSNLVPFIEEI